MLQPAIAEVDLSALAHNWRLLGRRMGGRSRVCPVLKADAYGHGLRETGFALAGAGADFFAVATLEEGLALREVVPAGARILVLLPALPAVDREAAELTVTRGLRATVVDRGDADGLQRAAERFSLTADIHVEIDTGMGRMGVPAAEAPALFEHLRRACPRLRVEGVFTHFADAENLESDFALRQAASFAEALRASGFPQSAARLTGGRVAGDHGPGPMLHAANSAAAERLAGVRLDMVRCGLSLYGYEPLEPLAAGPDGRPGAPGGGRNRQPVIEPWAGGSPDDSARITLPMPRLRPAMRVLTRLVAVKRIPAGHSVGYGRTWTAARDTLVGIAALGYEDGYPRALSNQAVMTVAGRAVPVLGRVSMDQVTLDLTDLLIDGNAAPAISEADLRPGLRVVAVEADASSANGFPNLARLAGTIPYELLIRLGKRVHRQYVGTAEIAGGAAGESRESPASPRGAEAGFLNGATAAM